MMKEILATVLAVLMSTLAHSAQPEMPVFDCVIDPSRVARIGSPVTGILEAVNVRRGDRIQEGKIIASVNATVEKATVALAAARAASDAEVEKHKARLHLAEQKLKRMRELISRKVESKTQLDEIEAEFEVVSRELAQAQLRRGQAKLELVRAMDQANEHIIRSPIDGIIVERHMTAGEYVHQEAVIVTIARIDPLYAETFLPVRWYKQMQVGTVATVMPNEPVGGRYEARVTIIDQVFDSSSGTFGVRAEIPNPSLTLPAGQRCKVTFDLEEQQPPAASR